MADLPGKDARGPGTDAAVRAEWDRTRDQRDAARASRGDVAAFSRLVEAHSGLVLGVALRVLGPNDAQDASQEAWVRVWRSMERFRGDSAFTTWLYRITMNTCLSIRQKETRLRAQQHGGETPLMAAPAGDAGPETVTLNDERRTEIESALERVRADHRAALVLRHMEGLSYAEIAEVLGVPAGTAKGWASRGRAAMLAAFSAENGVA